MNAPPFRNRSCACCATWVSSRTTEDRMDNLKQIQSILPALTDAEVTTLESAIREDRAARIVARDAALPEFPWVVSVDRPEQGHGAGMITQVTRASAIELLNAGCHRLATPEEVTAGS